MRKKETFANVEPASQLKIKEQVKEGKRGSCYPALKRFGLRPGREPQSGFQLPEHAEHNLSSAQSAEIIANHFSSISQEYAPLNLSNLAPNVQTFLKSNDRQVPPTLSISEVQSRIVKAKKPNGLVRGDLPKKVGYTCHYHFQ